MYRQTLEREKDGGHFQSRKDPLEIIQYLWFYGPGKRGSERESILSKVTQLTGRSVQ